MQQLSLVAPVLVLCVETAGLVPSKPNAEQGTVVRTKASLTAISSRSLLSIWTDGSWSSSAVEKMNERKRRGKKKKVSAEDRGGKECDRKKKTREKMNSGESDLKTRSQFRVVCSCLPMVE